MAVSLFSASVSGKRVMRRGPKKRVASIGAALQ
jgi:hypothetical protein